MIDVHGTRGTHGTRISTVDGQAVTVRSASQVVTDWARRYFGSWWNAEAVGSSGPGEAVVIAGVAPDVVAELTRAVLHNDAAEVMFAGDRMYTGTRHDGVVTAVQPGCGMAYRWEPVTNRLVIAGENETMIATAAARLAREIVRGRLLADGWRILHASAVTGPDGATVLALGDKGAGKTTCGFLLARAGWKLLANDRVFVRAEEGVVRALPWPSAAAIGFGLLDALGLYDAVRDRVLEGARMHPTQHHRVTDALVAGEREPLWKASGKELKPQFFPDQLTEWLGMDLSTEGTVAGVLFPEIRPGAEPTLVEGGRGVMETDFFTATTEDRYPDVFGLLPVEPSSTALEKRLASLPHQSLVLGHDTAAATAILHEAAGGFV